jgi:aspartate/methionine/tyrosine aminotransferase
LIGQPIGGQKIESTLQLADVALEQANIAFVPGEAFGSPGYGRFSYALGDDDLGEGLSRLAALVAS